MHGDLALRGWFVWFVYGIALVLWVGAIAVIVNALRRPTTDFGRFGRGPWVVLQVSFLVLSALALAASPLGFASALPAWSATLLGTVVIAAAVQQISYLLRVVFPKPPVEPRAEDDWHRRDSDAGD